MTKVLEGVTIETFPQAVQQGQIRPGQRFDIILDEGQGARPKLADIASRMRQTAAARGMTTDIFDSLITGV